MRNEWRIANPPRWFLSHKNSGNYKGGGKPPHSEGTPKAVSARAREGGTDTPPPLRSSAERRAAPALRLRSRSGAEKHLGRQPRRSPSLFFERSTARPAQQKSPRARVRTTSFPEACDESESRAPSSCIAT